MSTSTDGQICFGIPFEEGFPFPWENYGEDDWWREVVNGIHIEDYGEQFKWNEANPVPVRMVNYCSGEYPMYMLAVPESCISNSRGYTEEFDPANLKVTDEQKQKFIAFCEKYLKDAIDEYNNNEYNKDKLVLEPKWHLSSYWG